MKAKKLITYILGFISIASIFLASGIKEVSGWEHTARPFFLVWFATLMIALIINNINYIRRFTYPAIICLLAWLYKHNIMHTEFSKHAYRVYKYYKSFGKLYMAVQDAFDYYMIRSEV